MLPDRIEHNLAVTIDRKVKLLTFGAAKRNVAFRR